MKKLLKRLLNIGQMVLIFLFVMAGVTFAETAHNPFENFDKQYMERLSLIKDMPDEQESIQRSLSQESLAQSDQRYMVKFKEDISMEEIFDLVKIYDYKVLGESENRLFVLELMDLEHFQKQSKDAIEFIEKDFIKESNIIPSDPFYSMQWALPALKLPEAWEISKGSNSVFVAVIDSGIQRRHPDLINTDIRNGWDYIFNEFCQWDATGHGTNVTGIIGAQTNNKRGIAGVNWNVGIIPLRVSYSDGTSYISDTVAAIYDAADLGCDVINISLGSEHYSHGEDLAVAYATSKGSIVVASAGNAGSSTYYYPASHSNVVSVGSVGRDLKVSDFSQRNNAVNVTAPGEAIYTTMDRFSYPYGYEYGYVEGTSFSTPYVSGIAALMSAVKPTITTEEFMEKIKLTATDLGPPGYDIYYGHGLINGKKMLESVSAIKVQSVRLNKSSIKLKVGETEKITATVLPSNATNKDVTWQSNNPKVATVNNGTITAIDGGTAIITVTTKDGGKVATLRLKVEKGPIWNDFKDVSLDKVWTVQFNKKLDSTSWKENVQMLDSNNETFPISISKSVDGKSLIITPLENYDANSSYRIVIDDIISHRGMKLNEGVYISFTTR